MTKQGGKDRMLQQLVKLADMIETCDYQEPEYSEYQKEYKKIAKVLYPEMYSKKRRNPSNSLLKTLTPCECSEIKWRFKTTKEGVQFTCASCDRVSKVCATNAKARDSWNKTFIKEEK